MHTLQDWIARLLAAIRDLPDDLRRQREVVLTRTELHVEAFHLTLESENQFPEKREYTRSCLLWSKAYQHGSAEVVIVAAQAQRSTERPCDHTWKAMYRLGQELNRYAN